MTPEVISVAGLHRTYGDNHAVRGIDLAVRRGEIVGLLGPNGAGKTTTVEILGGFRRRDAGSVRVLGFDPGQRSELAAMRERVGIVLQQTSHYRYLSVGETLWMHQAYYRDPRSVDEVLEIVGLRDAARSRFHELSGGQQRRLDVAVALIGRPELVFLDEPTTGFDPSARRRFWHTIAALRDLGTTILLTTHYMEEAQQLADRVAVMRDGAVVGTGTPAELARQLRLASTLTFTLPASVSLDEIPHAVQTTAHCHDGVVTALVEDPTTTMAMLCGWALERGITLGDMELRTPSLEQSYLQLTDDTLPEGEAGDREPHPPVLAGSGQ